MLLLLQSSLHLILSTRSASKDARTSHKQAVERKRGGETSAPFGSGVETLYSSDTLCISKNI